MTADELVERLDKVKRRGGGWIARCPAHADREPSLSIGVGDDRRILLHCHAGCTPESITAALNLSLGDLMGKDDDKPSARAHEPIPWDVVETYDYRDPDGNLAFQVLRMEADRPDGTRRKTFRQRRPNPQKPGDWLWTMEGQTLYPYMLPEIRSAIELDPSTPIWVCEGEKDVHTLLRNGQVATTNPGGAGKWKDEYSALLRACGTTYVKVIQDNDEPGVNHALQVTESLRQAGIIAQRLRPHEGFKDVTDHLTSGHYMEELEDSEERPTHSWAARQMDGPDPPPFPGPSLCGIYYDSIRHLVMGEPESMKSWSLLQACIENARRGQHSMYVDIGEMSEREVRVRLKQLGATEKERAMIHYIEPQEQLSGEAEVYIRAFIRSRKVTLVVIDAMAGLLSLYGMDENSNKEITDLCLKVLSIFDTGYDHVPALIVADHVTKNKETRGRWASGAHAKIDRFRVALALETVIPLVRDGEGIAKVFVSKDRPAHLNRKYHGKIVFTDTDNQIRYELQPIKDEEEKEGSIEHWMRVIKDELALSGPPLSKRQIIDRVKKKDGKPGSRDLKLKAIDRLEEAGDVTIDKMESTHYVTLRKQEETFPW